MHSSCLISCLTACFPSSGPLPLSPSPHHAPALSLCVRGWVYQDVQGRWENNLACQPSPSTLTQGLSVLHWCLRQADCPAAFQEISRLRLPSLGRGLRDSRHLYCCVRLLCPFQGPQLKSWVYAASTLPTDLFHIPRLTSTAALLSSCSPS